MSRPLMYDDQFISILNKEIRENFIFCIPMKVQRSAFYKSLSLQNSLRICSGYDILCALFIMYCGSNSLLEILSIMIFLLFGISSINNSINLNRVFAVFYYYYRIIVLFCVPLVEYYHYTNESICYYSKCNNFSYYTGLTVGISIINLYFAKIAWSFSTRLKKGQELLVIHGKYMEEMVINENQKISESQLVSKISEMKQSNIVTSEGI